MQTPEEGDETHLNKSRPTSRRSSCSSVVSRKNSAKKESTRKSTQKTSPLTSSHSTPKKTVHKQEKPDFLVTGKQILKKYDRANSLPGVYHRRPSSESLNSKVKRSADAPRRTANVAVSVSSKSRDTSLEDDVSLDLSQVSDFEDTNSKYGVKQRSAAAAATCKVTPHATQKIRSGSLQSQRCSPKLIEKKKSQQSLDSSKMSSNMSLSRDSFNTSSAASIYTRCGPSTELDYSSVSPEYSGQSSTELSPRAPPSPPREEHTSASSCYTSWLESNELDETKVDPLRKVENGEWNNFWANYNNSVSRVPMKSYYDQCPTPYRTDNIDLADLDFSAEGSRKRSPDMRNINNIIRNEGLHLTPRETQNIIKCAHILGNVLSKAMDRTSKHIDMNEDKIQEMQKSQEMTVLQPDAEVESKKKTLKLELKEQNKPSEEVQEEKKCETVTTQTDISLPNTKSAPRIFEKILRQLSKSSIDESILEKQRSEKKEDRNEGGEKREEVEEVKEEKP